jgi:hypothetical protein
MITSLRIRQSLAWVIQSVLFFKKHYLIILALGMVAALGRAAQLRAFGAVSPVADNVLEVLIQSARIMVFVYSLGLTNVKKGALRLGHLFTSKATWKENSRIAFQKFREDWRSILASMVIYLLIALLINKLIDYTAYQTCLYAKLKTHSIISGDSSEWVIILFFKNLSVIPFTLVFNALFLLWITNKTATGNKY